MFTCKTISNLLLTKHLLIDKNRMFLNKIKHSYQRGKYITLIFMLNASILFFINAVFTPIYAATIIDTIIVGNTPQGIDVNSQINKVYTANINDNTVSVIDGSIDDLSNTITVGMSPAYLVSNPVTHKVYVSNNGDDTVSVIDGVGNNILKTINGFHLLNPPPLFINL